MRIIRHVQKASSNFFVLLIATVLYFSSFTSFAFATTGNLNSFNTASDVTEMKAAMVTDWDVVHYTNGANELFQSFKLNDQDYLADALLNNRPTGGYTTSTQVRQAYLNALSDRSFIINVNSATDVETLWSVFVDDDQLDYTAYNSLTTAQQEIICEKILENLPTAGYKTKDLLQIDLNTIIQGLLATKSSDATLSDLSLSNVTFTPLFDPEKTSYTAYVADTVRNTIVTATPTDSNVTIAYKLNNTDVTATMTLQSGDNTIDVIVTAQDGTTKTYTVKVTVVTKSAIEIGDQTIEAGATVEVPVKLTTAVMDSEAFQFDFTYDDKKLTFNGVSAPTDTNTLVQLDSAKQTGGEIRVIGASNKSVFVTGTIAVLKFTAASALVKNDTTTVNLSNIELSNGSDLPVNATDDATLTVDVKASAIATLTDLQLKGKDNTIIAFNETFAKDTVTYTAAKTTPGNDVTVQVTKENEKSEVTYKLNGVVAATADMTLQPGKNVIEVIVTAEDKKTVKTYNITVTMGLKGDADVDGDVDINDWQKTVAFILDSETPSAQAKWNTDMNDSTTINISDWVLIANKLVGV